jgi:Domain of unknown function (DUF5615)
MKIHLYADEDAMDSDLIEALRRRGMAVTTALDAHMIDREDVDHLEYAASQVCVLYSFNARDYLRLHQEYMAAGKSHTGIILAPQQQYSVGEQLRRLLRLMATKSAEDMIDHVEFLSSWH